MRPKRIGLFESYKIYLAKKRLKPGVSIAKSSNATEFRSLLLLYDSPGGDLLRSMENLRREFDISEKNFHAVFCGRFQESGEEKVSFQLREIAYNGKIKNPALTQIIESGPDLVISYTERDNPEALFLREIIPAGLKAGRFEEKEINLSIKDEHTPEIFAEELLKYLKILKGE